MLKIFIMGGAGYLWCWLFLFCAVMESESWYYLFYWVSSSVCVCEVLYFIVLYVLKMWMVGQKAYVRACVSEWVTESPTSQDARYPIPVLHQSSAAIWCPSSLYSECQTCDHLYIITWSCTFIGWNHNCCSLSWLTSELIPLFNEFASCIFISWVQNTE